MTSGHALLAARCASTTLRTHAGTVRPSTVHHRGWSVSAGLLQRGCFTSSYSHHQIVSDTFTACFVKKFK